MKTTSKRIFIALISVIVLLTAMSTVSFAEDRIPVEKIVVGLTSGSIDAPNYGSVVVHPTFEILSTVPAEAKDCYKIDDDSGWVRGYSGYLEEGDTFDEDTYRLFVYTSQKTKGAGDAYTLSNTSVYLLHNGVEQKLYNSASSAAHTFKYIDTYEVKAPSDIMPTITTTPFQGEYIIDNLIWEQMEARGSKPITWSATGLPAGVSINSTGLIVGRPKQSGVFNVKITATNSAGSVTKRFALHVKKETQKIKVNSIICDFDYNQPVKVPVDGYFVSYSDIKIISTEPAEAIESIGIHTTWYNSNGTILNYPDKFGHGEYKFSLRIGALNNYELAEDCIVYFGNTPLTVDSFSHGILSGHIMYTTVLSQKPTNLSVNGTYTFNGKYQVPNITGFDSKTMRLVDTVQKNAGTYTATVKPWHKWADGTTDEITLDWTIEPFFISTAGTVEVTQGVNKYTGYAQEVNIESVKATVGDKVYTLERGVDYVLWGDCTSWTNVGLAGGSTDRGYIIKGIGNYTGLTPNQWWTIEKGDQTFPELIIEVPITPGGKGAIIGTTTDMIYQGITMQYPLKCTAGRMELAPGKYAFQKNGNANYNAVGTWITIPEYDPSSVSTLAFNGNTITATNRSGSSATCIIALYETSGQLLDVKTFAVAAGTIVNEDIEELGITTSEDSYIRAMLWSSINGMRPIADSVQK